MKSAEATCVLVPVEDEVLRKKLPTLTTIWTSAELSARMADSMHRWMQAQEKAGELFFIQVGSGEGDICGITGWYEIGFDPQIVGLRWHGVLQTKRRQGISGLALRLLARRILSQKPGARLICEVVAPDDQTIASYFKKLGFDCVEGCLGEQLVTRSLMPTGSTAWVCEVAKLAR